MTCTMYNYCVHDTCIHHLFMQIPGNQKYLRRTPSEQTIYDSIKSKMNQLISMRPPK